MEKKEELRERRLIVSLQAQMVEKVEEQILMVIKGRVRTKIKINRAITIVLKVTTRKIVMSPFFVLSVRVKIMLRRNAQSKRNQDRLLMQWVT